MVASAVGAGPQDVVLFAGAGATAGMALLQHSLSVPASAEMGPPLVLAGPYSHHSSLLGWREAGAEVIILPEALDGGVHLGALEAALLASWGVGPNPLAVEGTPLDDIDGATVATRQAIEAAIKAAVDGVWAVPLATRKAVAARAAAAASTALAVEAKIRVEDGPLASTAPLEQARRQRCTISSAAASMRLRIGVFAVASNITGLCNPISAITALLHTYGAISALDAAAAAPHVGITMNPTSLEDLARMRQEDAWPRSASGTFVDMDRPALLETDAVVFSPHKFVGGPGSPGVLVIKRFLLRNQTPPTPGGGTVFFVHEDGTPTYLQSEEQRNEGGTPDILGSIRAGLALHLASRGVGYSAIKRKEQEHLLVAHRRLEAHPNIRLFSKPPSQDAPCLPIISLSILSPDGWQRAQGGSRLQLHWGFVVTLLNDLFGIQCRGGCMCAGPYALRLLRLKRPEAEALQRGLLQRAELLRPGVVRFSLPYHLPATTVDFVLTAVEWVADHGAKLLRQYIPVPHTGEWRHRASHKKTRPREWLHGITYEGGVVSWPSKRETREAPGAAACLAAAEEAARTAAATIHHAPKATIESLGFAADLSKSLRWFALSSDAPEEQAPPSRQLWLSKAHQAAAKSILTTPIPEATTPDSPSFASLPSFTDLLRVGRQKPDQSRRVATSHSPLPSTVPPPQPQQWMQAPTPPTELPKALMRSAVRGIMSYDMIRPHDTVCVALSGGKDSMTLLHALLQWQKACAFPFDVVAATIDPGAEEYDPSPLKPYLDRLGVRYEYVEEAILRDASTRMQGDRLCAFCARRKRGALYAACERLGANVLALGQHLDDIAESFLMYAFMNGTLGTMKAAYTAADHPIRIVRPLVLCRERDIAAFARAAALPLIAENCPACFSAPTERARMKLLLAAEEQETPRLFHSILRTLRPLLAVQTAVMPPTLALQGIPGTGKGRERHPYFEHVQRYKRQQQGKPGAAEGERTPAHDSVS